MVWKVVKDAVWRMWVLGLMTSSLVAVLWLAVGSDGGIATATAFAASMAFTFVLGPFVGFALFGQKEFIYLPLSRRQLWRARLTVALIVPITFMLAAKLLALAAASVLLPGSTLTLGTVLLSSVYDFAYAGAGLGLLAWSGLGRTHRQIFGEGTTRSLLLFATTWIIAIGPGWPFLFRTALPTEWNQLTGGAWLLLAAGLAVAVAIFFRSPKLAHSGRGQASTGRRKTVGAWQGTTTPAIGIARLMCPEIAISLGLVLVFVMLFECIELLSGDRLDSVLFYALLVITLSGPSAGTVGVRAALRPLRTLPLSTWTVSVILATQPIVTWVAVWVLLVFAGRLVILPVPALTPGMLGCLVGITSLVNAVGLALTGSRFQRYWSIPAFILAVVVAATLHVERPIDLIAPYLALGGTAVAVWLISRTVRRNNLVFRSEQPGLAGLIVAAHRPSG